ncbi:hypothetical protein ABZ819_09220 [Streptomyces venezuelae]
MKPGWREWLALELEKGPATHGWVEDQQWTLARISTSSCTSSGNASITASAWSVSSTLHMAPPRDQREQHGTTLTDPLCTPVDNRQDAAMDAVAIGALAGVMGAAVGAAGAIGAATVSVGQQARTQEEHWRRQCRRDAYVACLSPCVTMMMEMMDLHDRMTSGTEREGAHAELELLRNRLRDFNAARLVLHMEGPASDGKTAHLPYSAIWDWTEILASLPPQGSISPGLATSAQEARSTARGAIEEASHAASQALDRA